MVNSGWKAIKAFGVGLALSGMIVACNEATQSAKPILPNEQTVNNGSNSKSAVTLTALQMQELKEQYEYRTMSAAQRDQKKREFFARADVREASQGLDELAQMIAVAVEDKMLRDRIYEKCMERFDGATNTLWKHLEEDSKLRLNGGWNKRIGSLLDKKGGVVKNLGNLDAAVAKFERTLNAPLHLFWIFPENWDKKTTPVVAFRAIGAKGGFITAYDSKGVSMQSSKELAQKRPVLVIAFNERTTIDGNLKPSINFQPSDKGAAMQSGNAITLSKAWFSTGLEFGKTIEQYYDEVDEGPPEFTCEVFPSDGVRAIGSRIQDNNLGNISLGGWVDVSIASFYPPYSLPAVIGNWGNNTAVFVKYWEDDWWFFDDFVGEHPVPKNTNNMYEHQGSSDIYSPQYNPKARYTW